MGDGFKYKLNGQLLSEVEIIQNAYDRAQHYDPETRKEYVRVISGAFKTQNMKNKWSTLYAPIGGAVLLVIILIVAFLKPFPTRFQTGIFWIILSLAASACAALIPGFLEIKYKNFIRASGAIAVFVLMYFSSPNIINEVDNKQTQRLELYVVSNDSLGMQRIVIDFDNNNNSLISDYIAQHLGAYYGMNLSVGDFTCYRRSDGKIYNDESCRDVTEYKMLLISKKVIAHFADKREAYIHYTDNNPVK